MRVPREGEPHLPLYRAWLEEAVRGAANVLSWDDAKRFVETRGVIPVKSKLTGTMALARSAGLLSQAVTWKEFIDYQNDRWIKPVLRGGAVAFVGVKDSEWHRTPRNRVMFRLRKVPRRHLFVLLASVWGADLLAGRFTRERAAATIGVRRKDVDFLVRYRLKLYEMVDPVRKNAGLPTRGVFGGWFENDVQWPPEIVASLIPLTTPTGVLGFLSRVLQRDGETRTYNAGRFLDRALRNPVGRERELADLLARYGVGKPMATADSRSGSAPAEVRASAGNLVPSVVEANSPGGSPKTAGSAGPGVICRHCGTLVRIPGGAVPRFCSTCQKPLE